MLLGRRLLSASGSRLTFTLIIGWFLPLARPRACSSYAPAAGSTRPGTGLRLRGELLAQEAGGLRLLSGPARLHQLTELHKLVSE